MPETSPFLLRIPADAAAFRRPREHAADRRRPEYGDGPCCSPARWRWEFLPIWQKAACSTCMLNLNVQLWTRRTDGTVQRILDLDAIMFQSRSGSTIKFDFGLLMDGHRADQIQLSQRKIALGSEGLIARSRSQFLLLLLDVECSLRKSACLPPALYLRARL